MAQFYGGKTSWPGSDLVDAGAAYSTAQRDANVVLYAGVGDWTGFPAPAFAYQGRAAGAVVPDLTSADFDPRNRFDLSGLDLTFDVTASNTGGPVTATTQTVTLPTIAPNNTDLDMTTGDVSAGAAGADGATISYNPVEQALDGVLPVNFSGIVSPAISVVAGKPNLVGVTFTNFTGGNAEVMIGSTPDTDDIARLGQFGGSTQQTRTTIITPSVDVIYITVISRGASGQIMRIHRWTSDYVAPVLSAPTAVADGQTGATLGVTTDTDSGNIRYTISPTGAGPDIIGFHAVNAAGVQAISTGDALVAGTEYTVTFEHLASNAVTSPAFTTDAAGPANYLDEDFGSGDFSAAYATLNAQSVSYNAGAGQLNVVLTGSNQGFRRYNSPIISLPQSVIDNTEQVEVVLDLLIPSNREYTVRLGRPGDDNAYGDFNRFLSAGTVQTTQIVTPTQTEFRVALFGRSGPAETFGLQRLRVRPVA